MEAIFELKEKHCRKHVNKVNHGHLLRVSVAVDGRYRLFAFGAGEWASVLKAVGRLSKDKPVVRFIF